MRLKPLIALALGALLTSLTACAGTSTGTTSSAPTSAAPAVTRAASPLPTVTVGMASPVTSAGSSTGQSELNVSVVPSQLKFDKTTLSAKAGAVTINFKNSDPNLTHSFVIDQPHVSIPEAATTGLPAGQSGKATVTLAPGTYHFYCAVPGHKEAGMEGTIEVK